LKVHTKEEGCIIIALHCCITMQWSIFINPSAICCAVYCRIYSI